MTEESAIRNPRSEMASPAGKAFRFRLTTPTRLLVDRDATYVQAEDASGRFGILPGHEAFLTALVPCVLVYRYEEGGAEREAYAAVREGALRVTEEGVQVAVRAAHLGADLAALREEVRKNRGAAAERSHRSERSVYQMQVAAWRRLAEFEHARE